MANYMLSSLPAAPRIVNSRGHTALSLFFSSQARHYSSLLATVSTDLVSADWLLFTFYLALVSCCLEFMSNYVEYLQRELS